MPVRWCRDLCCSSMCGTCTSIRQPTSSTSMSAGFAAKSTPAKLILWSTPFAASGFACVLLSKTLRSSTLKLAFVYVTGFSSAIFAVLGYVYWSTIAYVTANSDRTIAAESTALGNAYDAAGRSGLTALIDRRLKDRFFDDWVYLLADPSLGRIAGNLPQWPASVGRGEGWAEISDNAKHRQPGDAAPLRASYRTLPDGFHLLVGRKADG